ncbi:hypothetical protein [Scytonema hofmannii]|uniref:hypothetical protein n=1 Tax=Scytonema hofmannii TaxID=34078 RepID=UPI0004B048B0|nr:hypothetical protein [Scytonema hofmannii]
MLKTDSRKFNLFITAIAFLQPKTKAIALSSPNSTKKRSPPHSQALLSAIASGGITGDSQSKKF